jgi:hypothetical protein
LEAAAAAARRLSAAEARAARDDSLLRPLPGLDLPPPLPDNLGRSPTRVTTLPSGIRVATEDVPVMQRAHPHGHILLFSFFLLFLSSWRAVDGR